jgi:hypothetical protein
MLVNLATGQMMPGFCNRRRECRRCARYYRYRVKRRLLSTAWAWHVVLTMPERSVPTPENIKEQSRYWNEFLKRLRRLVRQFDYAWVRHHVRGGQIHLHVLLSTSSIDDQQLSEVAVQAGFGSEGCIRRLDEHDGRAQQIIVHYITDSLACVQSDPDGSWPRRTRRYQTSVRMPKLKTSWTHRRPS